MWIIQEPKKVAQCLNQLRYRVPPDIYKYVALIGLAISSLTITFIKNNTQ